MINERQRTIISNVYAPQCVNVEKSNVNKVYFPQNSAKLRHATMRHATRGDALQPNGSNGFAGS
jgi:hypothetical protein